MKFPSKLYNFNESCISKFPLILQILKKHPLSVSSLYLKTRRDINNVNDFLEVLDALYALNKIDYSDEKGVIFYVV